MRLLAAAVIIVLPTFACQGKDAAAPAASGTQPSGATTAPAPSTAPSPAGTPPGAAPTHDVQANAAIPSDASPMPPLGYEIVAAGQEPRVAAPTAFPSTPLALQVITTATMDGKRRRYPGMVLTTTLHHGAKPMAVRVERVEHFDLTPEEMGGRGLQLLPAGAVNHEFKNWPAHTLQLQAPGPSSDPGVVRDELEFPELAHHQEAAAREVLSQWPIWWLPEPIGVGAEWTATVGDRVGGILVTRHTRYRLTAADARGFTVEAKFRAIGDAQAVAVGGSEVAIERYGAEGTATYRITRGGKLENAQGEYLSLLRASPTLEIKRQSKWTASAPAPRK